MQSMDAQSITIRVPASHLNKILQQIEALGQVTAKEIQGSDVTEEMLDLNIRLDNAEELRKRLIKLLDRADKVEDAIKLEKELARVTETIETMKGKIRYLKNQVAFSTVTVRLNSSLPQQVVKEIIPFPWVCELGNEISSGGSTGYYQRPKGGGIKFGLSESFLRYYESKSLTRATSADGILIKVQRLDNIKDASLQFWTDLAKRALQMKQAVYISGTRHVKIGKKNNEAIIIEGTKEIGREKFAYMLCMAMTKRYVFTYEAWGREEIFQQLRNEIENSMKSMKLSGSFSW